MCKEIEEFFLFNHLLYSVSVIQCQSKYQADYTVVKNVTEYGMKEQRHMQYHNEHYPVMYQQLFWLDFLYSLQ